MNVKNNLLSFIYDKNYCICLYENKVFIYKFSKIVNFNNSEFEIEILNNTYKIIGKDLKIKKLTKDELIIEGNFVNLSLKENNEKN